jgi:hypothetical protein
MMVLSVFTILKIILIDMMVDTIFVVCGSKVINIVGNQHHHAVSSPEI